MFIPPYICNAIFTQKWNKFFGFAAVKSNLPRKKSNFFWQYYPSGCALIIKHQFLKKFGPFDESLFFYGDEVDSIVERAVAAGAKILQPVADQYWGDRVGRIIDPSGHVWNIATRIQEE